MDIGGCVVGHELEDALAIAQYQVRRASGTVETVPHDEVRARLGLEQR